MTVVKPGLLTTVQDLGRRGFQHHGIGVGGAMDSFALRVANLLVGNPESAAGLEVTLLGPTLRFEDDGVIAIAGGDLTATVNDRPLPMWHAVYVRAGGVLNFGQCVSGCRAYVAVAGGVDVPEVLGSRSTHLRARFGGLEGRPFRAGDVVPAGSASASAIDLMPRSTGGAAPFAAVGGGLGPAFRPAYVAAPTVRAIPGTHMNRLDGESRKRLFTTPWRVKPQSDRMGYRLDGATLGLVAPLEPISEPVCPGTVQLPSEGRPIALMADCQTTGGYPRIAQVATVDLAVLAQLKPGDSFTFEELTLEKAQDLYLARERELERMRRDIIGKVEWGGDGDVPDRSQL